MTSSSRCVVRSTVWAALVFGAARLPAAEEAAVVVPDDLLNLPNWSLTTTLSAMAGYRDNIGLSSARPDSSGFLQGEVEAMMLRLPAGGWDGYAFIDVTEIRYFSADITDHERTAFLTSEVRWQPSDPWRFGLQGLAYHHDQVFDVSTTEVTLDSALLKLTGAALSPSVRWEYAPGWWVEARAIGRKDHYAENLDGYNESEAKLRLGRTWTRGTECSLDVAQRWRSHDSREQYTASGRPQTGSRLKIEQRDIAASGSLVFDAAKQWRGTLTALFQENRDNGSGYFNFNRSQLTTSLSWKDAGWEVQGSASASQFSFPVQKVGIGIDPASRHKDEYRLTIEVKRQLSKTWSLLAFFESERALSNDDRSSFRINTGYTGLSWSWDNLNLD